MYLIVVGAGPIGQSLVELALEDGHNVAVIEEEEARARALLEKYDVLVLHADIAAGDALEEAGADRADALIATTPDDATNLMTVSLGLEHGVKVLVSVVNDRRHLNLFRRLGAHVLADPEVIVARHLYNLVRRPNVGDLITLKGGAEIFEVHIGPASPLAGRSLAQCAAEGRLPPKALIVAVERGETLLIPTGETVIQPDDLLTVFSQQGATEAVLKRFTGSGSN